MRRLFGTVFAAAVLVIAAGAAALGAGFSSGELPQVTSAAELRRAEGIFHDVTDDGWILTGEWTLACQAAGCEANPAAIRFDLAMVMVFPDGSSSHSHVYSDFAAQTVTLGPDSISITGTILGTGVVGSTDISIDLIDIANGNSTVFLEFPGNGHLNGPIGGVIVASR